MALCYLCSAGRGIPRPFEGIVDEPTVWHHPGRGVHWCDCDCQIADGHGLTDSVRALEAIALLGAIEQKYGDVVRITVTTLTEMDDWLPEVVEEEGYEIVNEAGLAEEFHAFVRKSYEWRKGLGERSAERANEIMSDLVYQFITSARPDWEKFVARKEIAR